jgi:hypothetical protein
MTMGTVPVVDPHPDVQKSYVVPRPGVPTTSHQAGNQSGLEASSNVVKNGPTENRRSDGVRSSQNSADSKTVKLGVPAEKKESLSGRSLEPSSNSLTRGTEKAGKPVKGKTKAQDEPKPKPKPKPARRPLEPIKEGVLVSLGVSFKPRRRADQSGRIYFLKGETHRGQVVGVHVGSVRAGETSSWSLTTAPCRPGEYEYICTFCICLMEIPFRIMVSFVL